MTTALPASSDFTGSGVSEAGFKTAIAAQRTFLSDLLGTSGDPADARDALGVPGYSSGIATASGTADAIAGAFTPAITTPTNGMTLYVRAALVNTTAATFTPNSGVVAAKDIVKGSGLALVAGDVAGAGYWLELQYDAALDKWVLQNPATGIATVTATNDASFASNSVKPASTSWVRGAMSAIAVAAGFSCLLSNNGYVKFPSWLGGLVINWGATTTSGSGNAAFTFAYSNPNATIAVFGNYLNGGNAAYLGVTIQNSTNGAANAYISTAAGAPLSGSAIGFLVFGY